MYKNTNILLVGCGKMGTAMISGWKSTGIQSENILVVEPHADSADKLHKDYGVKVVSGREQVDKAFHPDIVVFAVKPQAMDEVLPCYADFDIKNVVFLSIAAGKTLEYLKSKLGEEARVIRTMPNLVATIGEGISAMIATKNVDGEQREKSGFVMEAVGDVVWIEDEMQMDAVTAISGSGPAYVFYFIEAMIRAAEKLGLDGELAKKLTCSTVSGSANLVMNSNENIAQLIKNVTSPGGTTEAALEVLTLDEIFKKIVSDAVVAAEARSREINKKS